MPVKLARLEGLKWGLPDRAFWMSSVFAKNLDLSLKLACKSHVEIHQPWPSEPFQSDNSWQNESQ